MWATSVPVLVFLGLCVLDLGPMYATDVVRRQTTSSPNAPARVAGHNNNSYTEDHGLEYDCYLQRVTGGCGMNNKHAHCDYLLP